MLSLGDRIGKNPAPTFLKTSFGDAAKSGVSEYIGLLNKNLMKVVVFVRRYPVF